MGFAVRLILLLLLSCSGAVVAWEPVRYLSNSEFVDGVFADSEPAWNMLILDNDLSARAATILGHPYASRRLRYWRSGGRSAWILDEIGKTEPITLGIAVGPEGIEQIRVLVYREPRGGEIRQPFFRRQFEGMTLDRRDQLSAPVDGITGATLSVDAVRRLARLALVLHQHVTEGD